MIKMRYAAAAALATMLAIPAYAQTTTPGRTTPDSMAPSRSTTGTATDRNKVDSGDQKFVNKAIEGNLAEVQLGQLAQQKGTSETVKSLGKMLVDDHGKNNEQAKSLAQSLNVTAPTAPNKDQKKEYDRLSGLSGDKFDREFVDHMVKDHKKDISEFKKEAKSKNAQVANYANATVPDLEKHLQMAQQAQASVKQSSSRQNAQAPSTPRAPATTR